MTTPFSGTVLVRRMDLNMVNLSTKFGFSTFTHYEGTKGNATRNWSGFGRSEVTQGHRQHNHSIERVRFPIWL